MQFLLFSCSFRQNLNGVTPSVLFQHVLSLCRTKHESGPASVWTNSSRQTTFHHCGGLCYDANNLQCPDYVAEGDLISSWEITDQPRLLSAFCAHCWRLGVTRQGLLIPTSAWVPGRCRVFQTEKKNNHGLLTTLPGYSLTKLLSINLSGNMTQPLSVETSRTFLPCINKRIWDLAYHEWVIPTNPNLMLLTDCLKEFDREVNEFILSVSSLTSSVNI